jgi:hypothetical protein
MTGRGAQRCDQGFFNPGNNRETCKACPYGYTTSAAGAGITSADCRVELGQGAPTGPMGPCPIGEKADHTGVGAASTMASGVVLHC